ETRRPTTDSSRHPTRTRLQFLNGVYVEVRHDTSTHLRIADVRAIHGKCCLPPALAVDCKLLGEIRRAVRIGHSAGCQEQQSTEVTAVQRKRTHCLAGKCFTARCTRALLRRHSDFA